MTPPITLTCVAFISAAISSRGSSDATSWGKAFTMHFNPCCSKAGFSLGNPRFQTHWGQHKPRVTGFGYLSQVCFHGVLGLPGNPLFPSPTAIGRYPA